MEFELQIQIFSEASERCQAEKRKTINGEDILFAMSTLGFDNYVEPLKLYLQKYREAMKVILKKNLKFFCTFPNLQGERQIEAELSNLGAAEVMGGQQLQVILLYCTVACSTLHKGPSPDWMVWYVVPSKK